MNREIPSIDFLIDEWFRMNINPKYNNVGLEDLDLKLAALFTSIKDAGYTFEDIGIVYANKIKRLCKWQSSANPKKKEWWLDQIEIAWNKASAEVFPSTIAVRVESKPKEEKDDFIKNPVNPDLINKSMIIETEVDKDFVKLLGVPEDFCE
jgi:hypothetical protein